MHRPVYGSLLLKQHAGRATSSGEGYSHTRLEEMLEDMEKQDFVQFMAIVSENGICYTGL